MSYCGQQVRLGVDIGGTFTDVALEVGTRPHSAKVLTTYAAPEQAILQAVQRVTSEAGVEVADIDLIVHGTTLATNALIERKGAKTAFLTTAGFRDVIEMRTENRFEQYDLNIVLPPPLIARNHRFVVPERVAASGRELVALDETAVAELAKDLAAQHFESLAIGFLHSYVNPAHERRARDIVASIAPEVSVSLSSEVSAQMREFERFNTVCANAFIKPLMASYLTRLRDQLSGIGAVCPVYLMHSGGGLITVETAVRFPVRLLESGPAGGAIYAADVAVRHGLERILSFDMGGTTAKICLIEHHTPKTARTFEVARTYRFKKGSGMPISIPVIEMVEIGAGGGSIAHVDSMRQIRVGPESAGSEPGPACYQRGGQHPTVTDANLILGRLDPENFAGGDIVLSTALARAALRADIDERLGTTPEISAAGICELVDENMANAARVHAVENGKEVGNFTMVAYGGGAPLHACRLCEKLGIRHVLIPPGAGVGAAIGFLRAPAGYEAVRGAFMRLSSFDPEYANEVLRGLTEEAVAVVRAVSVNQEISTERKAYMRYRGQGWEIDVPLGPGTLGPDSGKELRASFETQYRQLFGHSLADLDVEVLNWSVRALSRSECRARVRRVDDSCAAEPIASRRIYDAKTGDFRESMVFVRESLQVGARVVGPAAIVERETTTIVTASFEAIVQADGCLLLARRETRYA